MTREVQTAEKDMKNAISAQEKDGLFVPIKELFKGEDYLFRAGSVAFVGAPGSGKTMNAIAVAGKARELGYRVVMHTNLRKRSDFENVSIIFFEDIFKVKNGAVPILKQKKALFETLSNYTYSRASSRPIGLIFTIQTEAFELCKTDLIKLRLLAGDREINLDEICLKSKKEILEKHFSKNNIRIQGERDHWETNMLCKSTVDAILNKKNLRYGFPYMIHTFCSNRNAFSKRLSYFDPEIRSTRNDSHCILS